MITFNVTPEEYNLLSDVVLTDAERAVLGFTYWPSESGEAVVSVMDEQAFDRLFDMVTYLLQAQGFDAQYHQTRIGRLCESIIDKMNNVADEEL